MFWGHLRNPHLDQEPGWVVGWVRVTDSLISGGLGGGGSGLVDPLPIPSFDL